MRPPRRRPSAALRLISSAVVVALTTLACSPSDGPEPGRTDDDRVAAVLELRAAVGSPAADLGTAAATVTQELDDLRAEPPVDPVDRLAAAGDIRDGALAELEEARGAIAPDLAGGAEGPDADAVRTALADASAAAGALVDAVTRDLTQLERIAHADERLTDAVAAWEEPGSRSQQLARLGETGTALEDLAAELDGTDDAPACATALARRGDAARELAEQTSELRDLVERRRGEEFDARRRELGNAPSASTRARVDADGVEVDCWRQEGDVVARAAEVAAALEQLVDALNPADLASSDRG